MEVTATLARFIVETRSEQIPESIRHEAKRALLNILGCAIGSGRHQTVERAVAALQPYFGARQATLAGRRERCDSLNAALVNGIAAHVLDFDDTHPHVIHPSAPVWPALLAAAEKEAKDARARADLEHSRRLALERASRTRGRIASSRVVHPRPRVWCYSPNVPYHPSSRRARLSGFCRN